MEHYYALIMAGGGGTRLWPMSRQDMPKQVLPLVEKGSMFKTSVDRLAPLFPPENVYVVTGRKYVGTLQEQAPEIPEGNFIVEPYGLDSGPAAALGVAVIQHRDPLATVAVLTADHHILLKEKFRAVLAAAYHVAQEGSIVTLGISPAYAATGFGYIHQGDLQQNVEGFDCFASRGFKEKPDQATAQYFLDSGEYSWNSGMFIWTAKVAMNEFQRQQPTLHQQFQQIGAAVDTPEYETTLAQVWAQVKKISLDYAVMEGAERMSVIPVDIGWSDIGSWGALYDILKRDGDGNAFKGRQPERVIIDARNLLVYSDKLVVAVGVEDMVVVETPDALLLCHKDRTQEVKDVVNHLLTTKNFKFL